MLSVILQGESGYVINPCEDWWRASTSSKVLKQTNIVVLHSVIEAGLHMYSYVLCWWNCYVKCIMFHSLNLKTVGAIVSNYLYESRFNSHLCIKSNDKNTRWIIYIYLSEMYCSYYSITQINTVQAFMRILTNFLNLMGKMIYYKLHNMCIFQCKFFKFTAHKSSMLLTQ